MATGQIKPSRRIVPLIFTVLILGGALHGIYAQSYSYELQTIPLKGDFINFSGLSFAQDWDGYMWFGSSEGLYRYQGTSVKVFRRILNDKHSLSANTIIDLHVDSEGVLWIGTDNGLNRFDKYTESFIRYKHNSADITSIIPGIIWRIVEDRHSNVWIATSRGFSRFNRESETFINYPISRERSAVLKEPNQIFNLYPDKEDNLWLFATDGVYRFHIPSGITEKMHDFTFQDDESYTWNMFTDKSGRCWLNTYRGLFQYDIQQHTFQPFILRESDQARIGNQFNQSMLEDGLGNIWIRTFDAIFCYNQDLELKYYLEHTLPYQDNYRHMELIKEMFVDNTGSIWFYSPDGINQLIKKPENFRIYNTDSTTATTIHCIHLAHKNLIWLGTFQGIGCVDRVTNLFQKQYGSPWWESGNSFAVRTMYLDRENTLWIGMQSKGLLSMVISEDGQRQFRRHLPKSVDSTRLDKHGLLAISNIFEDNMRRLWIGADNWNFLHYYDRKANRMICLVDNPSAKDSLPPRAIIRHQTGSDTLWAIGVSGIYKIMMPFKKISENQIMPHDVLKCQLIDNSGQSVDLHEGINVSLLDITGIIWLGTSYGLHRISEQRMQGMDARVYIIKSYTVSQGLPSNIVRSILPDEKGNLWIGTENGLSKLNIRSETFTNYFVRHGLPDNLFMRGSTATSEDGEMFFGTYDGMISFYPDSIYTNPNIAPVRITGISINNQLLQPGKSNELKSSISYTDKIELYHNQDNLSLEYAILNYNHPELNQYKYKLEGFNDDWVYAGNRTNVDFTNLDHGKYTFRVSGSNNDGIWNEAGTSLQITIRPPPWKTWYAYLVYGLMFTGIILWYYRFLRNRARLRLAVEVEKIEKEKMMVMDQMKSRFFTNISHEFRTPLTLILGPLEKFDTKKSGDFSFSRDLVVLMRQNARRLLRLINQLLDLSKLEIGKTKLQVSENGMIDFIRTLVLSFLSLAERKRINYEYDLPDSTGKIYYDQDKLEKILTNLISNALKFTPATGRVRIKVRFVHSPEQEGPIAIEIIISDTGKGIPQDQIDKIFDRFYQVCDSDSGEQEGTGIGLALTKELVDLYRGELSVESTVGMGSIFSVRLPVSKEQFNKEEFIVTGKKADPKPVESGTEPVQPVEPEEAVTKVKHALRKSEADPVILIVEDNADLRNYISSNLDSSYQILMAENGQQGLDRALESIPDLVISDVMMPELDGVEMCRQLKKNERTNHIPVIILTAKADRQSKMEGFTTGADDYIVKPFNAEELQVRVENLIQQRQKLRDKFMREFIMEPDIKGKISPQDKLLQEIMDILNHNLDKSDFSINQMSIELNMSRSQMYRKISALTGLSPTDLLRSIRLRTAASLFNSGQDNVSQVMYQVGLNNHSYFARCFRELYQVNPSEYIKRRKR